MTALVRHAIDQGVQVDVLERLVALQERVTERQARQAFFEAVAAVQEEVAEIPKTRTAKILTKSGANYSYSYAPLEAITRTIRPVLREHGLSYSWDVEPGNGSALNVTCILRHIDGHEERASFPVPVDTKAAMSDAQKNGAALTYGRRQSLIAVLGLTAADDDVDGADPEEEGGPVTEQQLAELNKLADAAKADKARFCEYMGVESMADIPASRFNFARKKLNEKKKGAS